MSSANGYDFVVTPLIHPRFRLAEVTAERSTLSSEKTFVIFLLILDFDTLALSAC